METDAHHLESLVSLRRAYGRSALLLSGGATLGLKHLGVVKALHDNHALPRIISGTSVGSMIAAVTCCHTDQDLSSYMSLASLKEVNTFEEKGDISNFWIKFTRFVNDGLSLFAIQSCRHSRQLQGLFYASMCSKISCAPTLVT